MAIMLGALHDALNMKHWPFILGTAFFAIVAIVTWTFVLTTPLPANARCDQLFAEFMTSRESVVVNRDGWLLYELNCNVARRYREFQERANGNG